MKRNYLSLFIFLLACIYSNKFYSQTYDDWRTGHGLANGSEYENPDGDSYLNYEEYGLGLNPNSEDADGEEFFNGNSITIGSLSTTDLSYRIYRAADYTITNKYVDWEIFASRWADQEWVGDYIVEEVGANTINITIPSEFTGQKFKLEVTHEASAYPNFDWEHMKFHLATAQPITPADYPYIAENGWGRGPSGADREAVLALNPNHKGKGYINGGIETHPDRYRDLSLDDWAVADEIEGGWAIHERSGFNYFDYRKPIGYQRRQHILDSLMVESESVFIDALGKTGNATDFISEQSDKEAYLEGYFEYCEWFLGKYPELRLINWDFRETLNSVFTVNPDKYYNTLEGLINNYYNAVYNEFVYNVKENQRPRMDWLINNWTRHGKVYVHNHDESFDPNSGSSHYQAAVYFAVMGRNSSWQGSELTPGQGGWKHETWREHIYPHRIGEPIAPATRDDAYRYTRDFENLSVVCDLDTKESLIKFYDSEGAISIQWGGITDIPVTGISVSPTSQTLDVGEKQQLTATVTPSNAITKGVMWSSSNNAVAKVSRSGIVTALSAGTVTITGTTVDGHKIATSTFSIGGMVGPWNLDELYETPEWTTTTLAQEAGMTSIIYKSLPYNGSETDVFAYYGVPSGTPPDGGWPAVVHTHGGGGTASPEWVNAWTARGYACISMDLEGHVPGGAGTLDNPGPDRAGTFNDWSGQIANQWYYHAVAQAIKAHSIIRSFSEINPDKIGISGASWGGNLSSTTVGVDTRFAFGIPVYGGGFLADTDGAQGNLLKIGEPRGDFVTATYDASAYFDRVVVPTFWINGTNDIHFDMSITKNSARAVKGPSTIRYEVNMPHSNFEVLSRQEIYAFANHTVMDGVALISLGKPYKIDTSAYANFATEENITSAELVYTLDSNELNERNWNEASATISGNTLSAEIPTGATIFYFKATDSSGHMVSTEYYDPNDVNEGEVASISVSPTSTMLHIGDTQQLTFTISPSDATNQTVSWSSDDTSIATVNSTGLVTAVALGTATITVTTQDGNRTATSEVTVAEAGPITCGSRIEAEDFNEMSGVVVEPTGDVDGVENLGYIDNGDWVRYNAIDLSCAGGIIARVASDLAGGDIEVRLDGVTGTLISTITVTNTGGWQTYVTESGSISDIADMHDVYLVFTGAMNVNWIEFTPAPACGSRIEAEDFNDMFGIEVEPTGDVDGVENIGYLSNGDWVSFSNLNLSCAESIDARVASNELSGGNIEVRLDGISGTLIGTIPVGYTGGWQTYTTENVSISDVDGIHDVYLVFTGGAGNLMNINWIEFKAETSACGSRIEAEDYNDMLGIQVETTGDVDGNENIGFISNGDWVSYSNVDLSCAGGINVRAASDDVIGGNIEVRLDGITGTLVGTLTINNTGDWQDYVTESGSIRGATGVHDVYLVFTGGAGNLMNINWIEFSAAISACEGRIEAEDFNDMLGVQVETTGDVDGNENIGYIDSGDWVSYSNIDLSCAGGIDVRVASDLSGGDIEVRLDGVEGTLISTITVTNTGDWQTYVTESANFDTVEGIYDVYLVFTGGMNVNWIEFTELTLPCATFTQIEAEAYDTMSGIIIKYPDTDTENTFATNGDWAKYNAIDLTCATNFSANIACGLVGGTLQVRIGGTNGTIIGTMEVTNTGSWGDFIIHTIDIESVTGVHDVYLTYSGATGGLMMVDWIEFGISTLDIDSHSKEGVAVHIYPNPVNDALTIKTPYGAFSQYTIFDINGRVNLQGVIPSNATELNINMDRLTKGFYLLTLIGEGSVYTSKLIKN